MKSVAMSVVLFCATLSSLTACSNSGVLQSLNVSVTQVNQSEFVNLDAVVNLGSTSLNGAVIPVIDPSTLQSVGSITVGPAANGNSQIGVSVNTDLFLHGNASLGRSLPNGTALPFNLSGANLLGIPILQHSVLYLGGDLHQTVTLGVALGISSLDSAMANIGTPSDLFLSHAFSASILGIGGIYASPTQYQNGVAIFGQYTAPIPAVAASSSTNLVSAPAAVASRLVVAKAMNNVVVPSASAPVADAQQSQAMSQSTQNKMLNFFYGKSKKLTIH